MSVATNEWYAVEVSGTTTELTANLNAVEKNGYEIFTVIISPRGWTVIARKPVADEKKILKRNLWKPRPVRRQK